MATTRCPTLKQGYPTKKEAQKALTVIKNTLGRYGQLVYKCPYCDHYHHGHRKLWMPGRRRR